MMIRRWTANKAIVFVVSAFVLYWILVLFIPVRHLRDVFNALAFGGALMITVTWSKSTLKSIKEEAGDGTWQLLVAITLGWFIVVMQRLYSMIFNWYGQPESWLNSPLSGFWPYSYMVCAFLFLAAPGISSTQVVLRQQTLKYLTFAAIIGSFVAGMVLGASIATE